jgi:hypothetical protein
MRNGSPHIAALVIVWLVLAACASPSPTIMGQITDTDIQVNVSTAPWRAQVEFTNVGSTPCELMEVVTEIPAEALPLYPDGTLNIEGTAEEPGLGPGSFVDTGDTVAPGATFRWQEPLLDGPGAYLAGPRIFLCNGPGDHKAGRYAVVEIDPPFGSPPP